MDMAEWRRAEGFWYNEELLRNWLHLDDSLKMARYLYTFIVMARKGFYSFAPVTFDQSDGDYYLMAKPQNQVDRQIEGLVSIVIPELRLEEIDSYSPVRLGDLISG